MGKHALYRRWNSASIRYKLMAGVLLMVLLPFSIWATLYFSYLKNSNNTTRIDAMEKNLQQMSMNIEQQMETYMSYARFFCLECADQDTGSV